MKILISLKLILAKKNFTVGFHERITLDLNDGGERHKSRIII
jgi:hypothetical protein